MQNMIKYIDRMLDCRELRRQAEIYDCDILELKDEYIQIPKMVNDVAFTYLNGVVGIWSPIALMKFCAEMGKINDRKWCKLSRALMSGMNCVEFTTKGYELKSWYHCMADKNIIRFYFLPTGNNDCYGYLLPKEKERKDVYETV